MQDTSTTTSDTVKKPVIHVVKGDVVMYPCWEGPRCVDLPRTVSAVIPYPENLVLYFREGGYGIVDREVVLDVVEAVAS